MLERLDGDALDTAIDAYLTDQLRRSTAGRSGPAPTRSALQAIAVDGKALKGSAYLGQTRRHLLSAVTQGTVATIAQVEAGSKTNETKHFQPLLTALDLANAVVTFDALHSVKANIA